MLNCYYGMNIKGGLFTSVSVFSTLIMWEQFNSNQVPVPLLCWRGAEWFSHSLTLNQTIIHHKFHVNLVSFQNFSNPLFHYHPYILTKWVSSSFPRFLEFFKAQLLSLVIITHPNLRQNSRTNHFETFQWVLTLDFFLQLHPDIKI